MSYLTQFDWVHDYISLADHCYSLDIWRDMERTVEDSPWHREANVAVHTTMVVDQAVYFAEQHQLSSKDTKLIMLSTLFHDFGKPASMEVKTNEETGLVWRSFYGHEKVSARWFEGFYVDNYETLFKNWLSPEEAYIVTFMIEHHLPYKITDPRKRVMYGIAITDMLDSREAYYAAIKADGWGRISDGHEEKKQSVLDWIVEFEAMCVEQIDSDPSRRTAYKHRTPLTQDSPRAVFLVGPSGAGKSTISNRYIADGYVHYSWDEYRLQFLDKKFPDAEYRDIIEKTDHAFYLSIDEEGDPSPKTEFSQLIEREFIDLVKTGQNIVVDNTNLTKKRRAHLLQLAQSKGYIVHAHYKQCSPSILRQRAVTRPDKRLNPDHPVMQWELIDVPIQGEFDLVIIDSSNYIKE